MYDIAHRMEEENRRKIMLAEGETEISRCWPKNRGRLNMRRWKNRLGARDWVRERRVWPYSSEVHLTNKGGDDNAFN